MQVWLIYRSLHVGGYDDALIFELRLLCFGLLFCVSYHF